MQMGFHFTWNLCKSKRTVHGLACARRSAQTFGLSKPSRTGRRKCSKRGTKVKPTTKSTDLSSTGNIVAFHMKPANMVNVDACIEVLHCISWETLGPNREYLAEASIETKRHQIFVFFPILLARQTVSYNTPSQMRSKYALEIQPL